MALEWTQQLLEDARGFRVEGEVQRSVERSQSEQAWSAKNEQRATIMYHYGIV